ncbi:hypothetical protein KAI92_03535 [Candidatus Parcubacteria bacterium]|nr:hypothetical protein [Candidatus Parcubacteria bacterium]
MEETKNDKSKSKHVATKGLDLLISVVIALIFISVPLFFTGLTAQGVDFEKMMLFYCLVLIGVVSWAAKGVLLGELSIKRTPLDFPILGVLIIFIASTLMSVDVKDSMVGSYGNAAKGLLPMIAFILFYYLIVNNINAKRIRISFWSFVFSGSLLIIYSLLQFSNININFLHLSKGVIFNPLGSVSALTMFILIFLSMLTIAISQTEKLLTGFKGSLILLIRIVLGVVFLSALFILTKLSGFTFWPIGWIIAIIGAVIVLMFFMAKVIKTSNLAVPFASFLVLIIFLVLGNFSIGRLNLPAEVSLSRSASWGITKNALRENPMFGSGPSTFYYNFSKFKKDNFNYTQFWNMRFNGATGILYDLLATVGILGVLSIVIVGLISLSVSFLTLIKSKDNELNSILLGLFSSFVSSILFALLFPQNNSIVLVTVLLSVLTVSTAIYLYPDKFKSIKLSFRASANYALALAAIFLVVSASVVVMFTLGLKMFMADVYAKQSLTTPKIDDKIKFMEQAINLAPFQDSYYLNVANNYMSKANQAAIGGRDQAAVGEYLGLALKKGKEAVNRSPNRAANNEALALIYENASFYTRGALMHAEDLYKKNIELDPTNPIPDFRMALINMARANAETDESEKKYYIEEAVKKYDDAILKKRDLAAAYYGKAIASEKIGKIDDAIEMLKNAVMFSSNNLDYRFELGRLFFNSGAVQLSLSQGATQEIAASELDPEGKDSLAGEELSVSPVGGLGKIENNENLFMAEQLFLSILQVDNNNANAKYSLAVLYHKIGQQDNARKMVKSLLNTLQDQKTKDAVREQFKGLY